ncbi:uncharacterized protein LOC124708837 [Lolium rigidum]|uniref:uncharacterized protein LOC124708837 n=1 Tax=Lolium rigidum TaxID=89674 RepID=UPI001F5DF4B2|nr:uncharacterized protein LOC124708837 [Lolium rigidum]XP_047096441.1 uncharacterized protein LOC124708837 [Lolium rigidum]
MPPETDSAAGLAAAVLAASTPRAAAEAVSSVAAFLRRHHAGAGADQPRAFFADALPALLFRLFVSRAPDSPPCFLDLAAHDPALAYLLESLLAPSGPLLAALAAADRHALLRFTFPRERLPDWLAFALSSTATSPDQVISPLLAGRVGSKLHLSVFEYYLFWFAYHPIPATSAKPSPGPSKPPPPTWKPSLKPRARLESWVSTIAPTSSRNPDEKPHTSLYLKLLHAYLKEFVPSDCAPPRGGCGTLLHQNSRDAAESFRRAEFLVHTLVQFWLVGNDFSPLPVQASRAYGLPLLSLLSRANVTLSERLPAPGLGNAVKLLVMYLNRSSGVPDARNVFDAMLSRKKPCDSPAGYWNPLLQRPLYRFMLRTLLFCPMGADIENVAQAFSAWMVYMEPWKVQQGDFNEYDLPPPGGRNVHCVGDGKRLKCDAEYSLAWQGYVLSNYLFYSSLVVHFLRFAHKFIHSDVASVLQMVSKVLQVLGSSELLGLIYKVDAAYHSNLSDSQSCCLDDVLKHLPAILEQLQDWEDGLLKHNTDGSFLHVERNSNLRLFSFDDNGAYNLLKLLLLRAESEIQSLPGDAMPTLQTLDVIKSNMKKVFYKHVESSQANNLPEGEHNQHHVRGDVFIPKHPSPGKSSLADMKNNGDWMTRPISDTEVAWLARRLICFSSWLNETLQLKHAVTDVAPTGPIIIKVDQNEPSRVGGPKDAARMVLVGVFTLFVVVGQWILRFMRMHRIRINLRILASKKLLALAMLYMVYSIAKNMLS